MPFPRRPRRDPEPSQPEAPRKQPTLEFLGARLFPDPSGWWVYALCDRTLGEVRYAGQSDHLVSRLRDHLYKFEAWVDPARIYLVPCRDQGEADLYELLLIKFYDPEFNTVGRREELEKRMRGQNRPFQPGHKFSTREFLDSRQGKS